MSSLKGVEDNTEIVIESITSLKSGHNPLAMRCMVVWYKHIETKAAKLERKLSDHSPVGGWVIVDQQHSGEFGIHRNELESIKVLIK